MRFALAILVAAGGFFVGFTSGQLWKVGPSVASHLAIGTLGAIGAAVPGFFFAGWFGREGPTGWIVAFLAANICTTIGGFLGGSILLPGYGSVAGLVIAVLWLAQAETAIAWVISFAIIQLLAMRLRQRKRTPPT